MKKTKRFFLGLLLLPLCYGVARALISLLGSFKDVPEGSFYFFTGIAGYFTFQWIFFRPIRTYVFGHELTHALAAWSSGGEVKKFKVSKSGGSVEVSKTNAFIALAPYIIPLYASLLMGIYFVAHFFYPLQSLWNWFLILLGITIGFHMALTAYALRQTQPDLKTAGKWLSAIFIFLGNAAVMVLLMAVLFPRTVSWKRVVSMSGRETLHAVVGAGHGAHVIYTQVQGLFNAPARN